MLCGPKPGTARRVRRRLRRSARCFLTWRRMSSASSWIVWDISGEASWARRVTPLRRSVASATWLSAIAGFRSSRTSISSVASSETCLPTRRNRFTTCSRSSSSTATFRPRTSIRILASFWVCFDATPVAGAKGNFYGCCGGARRTSLPEPARRRWPLQVRGGHRSRLSAAKVTAASDGARAGRRRKAWLRSSGRRRSGGRCEAPRRGADQRRVADALGAALADLATATAADEAAAKRELGSLGKSSGDLSGGVEAAEGRAQRRGGNGHDRAAQQLGRGPATGCDPPSAPQPAAGGGTSAPSPGRGLRPHAVPKTRRGRVPAARPPRGARRRRGAARSACKDRLGAAGTPAGGAERRHQARGNCVEEPHGPDPSGRRRARGAPNVK